MINGILQFIKKTILAIKLARHNALFVIVPLKTFRSQKWLARLLVKKNDLGQLDNLRAFLEAENNLFLNAAADEILARSDIVGKNNFYLYYSQPRILRNEALLKNTDNALDKNFYLKLFAEIVRKDYPVLREQYNFFLRRLDILLDMRFYASELEELTKAAQGFGGQNFFEVDWIRSNKQKLYLLLDEECNITNKLPKATQEDFVRLFGYLLFEKNWFVSSWQGIAVTVTGNAALLDFDFLYPVNDDFKTFAKAWFKEPQVPANAFEYKLSRALKVLQLYCPEVEVAKIWQEYLSQPDSTYKSPQQPTQLLHNLEQHGVVIKSAPDINFEKPQDLAYLLDSHRHKNDPRFRKSTVWYWGPLLIAIYVLFHYF